MLKIGNINDVKTDEFIETCKEHAKVYKLRGRNFETILNQTIMGEACEILVANHFGYNLVDFSIPEYDLIDGNKKIEIKHTVKNLKWWTFKLENYEFFRKHHKNLDYIFLCYVDKNTDDVYLKFKANAKNFFNYVYNSKFNDNVYYNNEIAARNGDCIIF